MHDPPPTRSPPNFAYTYPGSELTDEEVEFGQAMHAYQRRHSVRYPAWSDILFVLRSLGYRKAAASGEPSVESEGS